MLRFDFNITYVTVASRNWILLELSCFEIFISFYSHAYVDYLLQVWYTLSSLILLRFISWQVFACLCMWNIWMVRAHLSAVVLKPLSDLILNYFLLTFFISQEYRNVFEKSRNHTFVLCLGIFGQLGVIWSLQRILSLLYGISSKSTYETSKLACKL